MKIAVAPESAVQRSFLTLINLITTCAPREQSLLRAAKLSESESDGNPLFPSNFECRNPAALTFLSQ